jgi:hypothetical protein
MADVEFTLGFTTAQAQRLQPVVEWCAHQIEQQPRVLDALASLGVSSVDELTPAQQARLVLMFWLVKKCRQYEREQAEIAAGNAAEQDVEDNFPLGVD